MRVKTVWVEATGGHRMHEALKKIEALDLGKIVSVTQSESNGYVRVLILHEVPESYKNADDVIASAKQQLAAEGLSQ